MQTWTPESEQWIEREAKLAGFHLAGVAPLDTPGTPAAVLDAQRFSLWIDSGFAGEMDYLKRRDPEGQLLRTAVQVPIPWARSVIVCGFDYNAHAPASIDPAPPDAGWIARYAWSGRTPEPSEPSGQLLPTDYHLQLLARLRQLEAALLARTSCETRCYVDTGPLVERNLAARAGIGWTGKNTCILNQQLGSWLLLGVIVTSLPVPAESPIHIAPDRCGSCTRCIDACPTSALIAPRQMDASLCIAYLTIEKKGAIPEPLREPMGRQVFGCDICQDVCPWNARAKRNARAEPNAHPETRSGANARGAISEGMLPRAELVNPALQWLASMDNAAFKRSFKGSPLERTGRKRLQRNVAIAMGNSGDPGHLPQLSTWAAGDDPVLAESASWAIQKLQPS